MTTYDGMVFSAKLKALMKRHRYSQQDVADRVDVSQSLVSLWTKGDRVPDLPTAAKLAKLFDVGLAYLADDAQDEPPAMSEISEWERAVLDLIHALGIDRQEALRRLVTAPATPTQYVDPARVLDPRPLPQPGPLIPPGAPSYKPETPRKKQPG